MIDEPAAVLVASRSPAYAVGVACFLEEDGFSTAVAHTVDGVLGRLSAEEFAVVIVDERLGDAPAVEMADEVRRRHPELRMVFAFDGDQASAESQLQALASGACGCLLHSFTREAITEAVRDAIRGVGRFDADALRPMAEFVRRNEPQETPLTDQERVVLRLMRQQLTYKEIALRLGVSWHTVRTHAQSILRKHGVHSRRELDAWDSRRGTNDRRGHTALAG